MLCFECWAYTVYCVSQANSMTRINIQIFFFYNLKSLQEP